MRHLEALTPGKKPLLMTEAMKEKATLHRALRDTAKPKNPLSAESVAAAAHMWAKRNARDAIDNTLYMLAERFASNDHECASHVARVCNNGFFSNPVESAGSCGAFLRFCVWACDLTLTTD